MKKKSVVTAILGKLKLKPLSYLKNEKDQEFKQKRELSWMEGSEIPMRSFAICLLDETFPSSVRLFTHSGFSGITYQHSMALCM